MSVIQDFDSFIAQKGFCRTFGSIDEKKIALFGLSANPPTGEKGHAGLVMHLAQSSDFDEVWVLPVFRHQFSSKNSLALFDQRVELCRLAFQHCSSERCKVFVHTLEREVERLVNKHGTIDTLNFLERKCPSDYKFYLVLGTDTFNDIVSGKWKRSEELRQIANICVADRMGFHFHGSKETCPQVLNPQLESISSTSIRSTNPYPFWPFKILSPFLCDPGNIHPEVLKYIEKKELFFFSSSLMATKRSRTMFFLFIMGGIFNYWHKIGMETAQIA